ncbi:MAG: BspA family leucine-rich repeat surface protein, partial [Deltaproteobacteria bacterium]|nr:BspA family leucine-rich repeat surface protein [Deltaproteobacteria bacterium]
MAVAGTPGEVLYIDWGDGVKEEYTLIGSSLVITHDYGIGTFQQKWFVTKTAITTLAANAQRLSGELPLELQGFTSLVNFQIPSNSFNTDISANGWLTAFSSWVDLEFFYIYSNQLTGAITAWDVSALANMRYFLIYGNQFSGDVTDWDISGWTALVYLYMYNMTSIQGDFTAWDLSACTLLQRLYLYNLDLSGSIANIGNENWLAISLNLMFGNSITGLNDYTLTYFDNRATYTASTKTINISENSELLTGTYQQPDLGTYGGSVHDLTEVQITNLSDGLDYDGLGTNVVWSTLEKVWILENLDTTSSSGV